MSLGVETYWDVCIPVASVGRKYGTPIWKIAQFVGYIPVIDELISTKWDAPKYHSASIFICVYLFLMFELNVYTIFEHPLMVWNMEFHGNSPWNMYCSRKWRYQKPNRFWTRPVPRDLLIVGDWDVEWRSWKQSHSYSPINCGRVAYNSRPIIVDAMPIGPIEDRGLSENRAYQNPMLWSDMKWGNSLKFPIFR